MNRWGAQYLSQKPPKPKIQDISVVASPLVGCSSPPAATAIPQSLPHPLLLLKLLLLLAEGRVRKASLAPAVDRTPRGSSRRRCRRRRLSGLGDGTGLPNERDAVYRSCVRCAERAPRISGLSETPLVDRMDVGWPERSIDFVDFRHEGTLLGTKIAALYRFAIEL